MINLGDKFESFSSFEKALEIFKLETNTDFTIRESKMLETASVKMRYPRAARAPRALKYYTVRYSCIHAGAFRKSKSRGIRSSSTLKIGCKAGFHLFLSDDEQSLVVKSLNLEHNHDTSEPIFVEVPTHIKRNTKLKVRVTESNARKRRYAAQENIPQDTENASLLQNLNASNTTIYLTPDGTECAAPYGLAPDEAVCEAPVETEINHNTAENVSYSLPEVESSEHKLCKCGIGTFDLTKQDLMKMEVEEHYHRLEVLQLQKTYETERIEKMRYLYDLKIQLAEQELQNSNLV